MTSSDPRVGRAWSLIVLEALDVWKHLPTGILLCLVPTAALRNTVHLGLWQSCNLGPLFWIFIFLYVDECLLTAPEYLVRPQLGPGSGCGHLIPDEGTGPRELTGKLEKA